MAMSGRAADLDSKPAGAARGIIIAVTLLLAVTLAASCSDDSTEANEVAGANHATKMSAEQCQANGQIMSAAAERDGSYVIQPNDELNVTFYLNPEFNQDVTVRPDGKVAMQLVGNLPAAGHSPQQLAQEVDQAYSSELRNPGATVVVKNMPSRQVFVDGQVTKPGMFPLEPGMTALQAVAEAGGRTEKAANEAVLIRRDACGVPTGTPINIKDSEKGGGSEDVALQSRDIVVVPQSHIANMNQWMEQYIRNMLPIQPYLSLSPIPAF
jgi:protein involved in polysaccharide export with SLBB domain